MLISSILAAEVVILNSGQSVRGEIVLQNEDVVIVRTVNGMRYQYPMTEVKEIKQEKTKQEQNNQDNALTTKRKAVSLRLQAAGGALYVPYLGWGGYAGADLMIGANVLEGKRLFVGGAVGYRARIVSEETYSFIPLQIGFSAILREQKHAPVVGINIGYGFSTNRKTQGGICAGADVGWHYAVNQTTGIIFSLNAEWQQAQTDVTQTIIHPETQEQKDYINHLGVNFITFGAKFAIHF